MPRGIELDGSHALVANGYGGYGVNIEPRFRPLNDVYLRNGVIYVIANLRGGAELGEVWHEGGSLVNKQNVFDDFAAVITFSSTTATRAASGSGSSAAATAACSWARR